MNKFIEELGINIDFYAAALAWALIFSRVFAMLLLVPFLGGRAVPGRIRIMMGLVLTTFVFYFLHENIVDKMPDDKSVLIALFLKEIFFGMSIGIVTIMCFYAIEAGGRIVDNQRGSANAQIFLPALGQVSIFGLFKFWVGLALFCAVSGHIVFLRAFLESFITVPVFSMPNVSPGVTPFLKLMIRMSADVLIWGTQLAAPVLIGIFLTDMVLGIANKMAPQIPVFEIGFMLKGYVGVAMVYFSIYVLTKQMDDFFSIMNRNVGLVVRYFGSSI